MTAITIAAAVLTVLSMAFLAILLIRRYLVDRDARRRQATERRLRPFVLDLIAGRTNQAPQLSDHEREIFAGLMARYAQTLEGESRARITQFFAESGLDELGLAMLDDRRDWRRANAAQALGDMRATIAVDALLRTLENDSSREVRACSARALGKLGAAGAVHPLIATMTARTVPHFVAAEAIRQIGPPAVPALRLLADGSNRGMRAAAVELLGYVGDADCAPSLVDALHDSRTEVRANAAQALGRLAAADGAQALRAALADASPEVSTAAANALGRIRDRDSVPDLINRANDPRFDAARAAARALAAIDPRTLLDEAARPGASEHLCESADLILMQAG